VDSRRSRNSIYVVGILVALVPLVITSNYQLGRVQLVLLYSMVAIGLNLGFGYGGQFAIAQPAIMGTSAYTAGVLSVRYGWSAWETLPIALSLGVLLGGLISVPGYRLRGWYLAITTFFAVAVFPDVIAATYTWTGGTSGLGPIAGFNFTTGTSSPVPVYELIVGVTFLVWILSARLTNSRWGIAIRSVRDAPLAATNCGINVGRLKMVVALVASVPVALAGWLWAHTYQVLSPSSFGLNLLLLLMAAVLLGGRGTLWGPVLGTVVFEGISLWIGAANGYNQLIIGGCVLVVATAFPHGLAGIGKSVAAQVRRVNLWRKVRGQPLVVAESEPPPVPEHVQGPGSAEAKQALAEEPVFAPLEASDSHGAAHATALEAKELSKSFGSVRVIEDVSLQLRLGKVHGLIGPNGSGKTTLLNMITGYVAPDQGTITANTTELSGKSASWIGASGIRRSFQIPQLIGELTVRDNIRLGALGPGRATLTGALLGPYLLPGLRRQGKGEERELDTIAASLALGPEVMDRAASEVPLGLRRIVEIGRAIMGNPVVICLDEPAAGLGPEDLVVLRSILESLARGGHSLLLIEHNLQFVGQVCDTVFQLEDGVLVSQSDYRPVRSASGRAALFGAAGEPAP
jgi:branched-chain amino acid transport system permease protein